MKIYILLFAIVFIPSANGADYEREKRWAEEVVPGLVVGEPVFLQLESGRRFLNIYTEVPTAKAAVIVVHGRGIHPDMGLIGVLRTRLADDGYTTLSVQMPVLSAEARGNDYLPEFPEARARLAAALRFLQDKGHRKIALVSHSMGARMSSDYLKHNPAAPLFAWVPISITNDRLGALGAIGFPVLDIYGQDDLPQVLDNNSARAKKIKKWSNSTQIMVPHADHFFAGHEDELVKNIKNFLDRARDGAR